MKHVTVWLLMLTILFCGYLISLISCFRKNHTQKSKKNYMIQFTKFQPHEIYPLYGIFLAFIVDSIHVVCAADYYSLRDLCIK